MEEYCDREDLIASYIDRTLPEAERHRIEEHLASCDRCLAELIAAQHELNEISSQTETTSRFHTAFSTGSLKSFLDRFIPPFRLGSSSTAGTVLALTAAVAAAVLFIVELPSYRYDPNYREGIHLLGKLLEVRETGELILSGTVIRSPAARNAYRGNGLLHLDLSLRTEERLERSLARYSGNARILDALGHFYMADGQPEMAVIYYERALRARPDDPALLNNLAAAVYRTGGIAEAERLLLEAEHRENPPPESYFNLGVLYGETGHRELQRVHFETYLGMAPGSPWADEARRILESEKPPETGRFPSNR